MSFCLHMNLKLKNANVWALFMWLVAADINRAPNIKPTGSFPSLWIISFLLTENTLAATVISMNDFDFKTDWINDFLTNDLELNALDAPITSPNCSRDCTITSTTSHLLSSSMVPFDMYPFYAHEQVPLSPVSLSSEPVIPLLNIKLESEPKKLTASEKKKMREYARNLTCFNCKTNKTPLWRRTECKQHNLCNACGLYYKQYKQHRPVSYKNRNPRAPKRSKDQPMTLEQVLQTVSESRQQPQGSVSLDWGMLQQLLASIQK